MARWKKHPCEDGELLLWLRSAPPETVPGVLAMRVKRGGLRDAKRRAGVLPRLRRQEAINKRPKVAMLNFNGWQALLTHSFRSPTAPCFGSLRGVKYWGATVAPCLD